MFVIKIKGKSSDRTGKRIGKIGMFDIKQIIDECNDEKDVIDRMHAKDALVAIIIPDNFSEEVLSQSKNISQKKH